MAVQRLLQEQGQKVIMTRSADVSVPLTERSNISNRNNADLFVSIHRNSNPSAAANGLENYIHINAPATDALYAHNVLDELANSSAMNNRGVIRADFSVLRNTNAPSMLIELGFISNARDNQLFDQHFNANAAAIARGITESLRGPSQPPPSFFFHTVTSSDSLWSLAQRFGTTISAIRTLNKLSSDSLTTRQVLKIPSGA